MVNNAPSKQPVLDPVAVTAYTALSAAGCGNAAFYSALYHVRTGLGSVSLVDVEFATKVGEINIPLPEINHALQSYQCRNAQVALAALDFAEDQVRARIEQACADYGPERIGVIIGTSTSGLYETEFAYKKLLSEGQMPDDFYFLNSHAYQATPRFLQLELKLQGPCYAISTACSSSAKAIAAGQRLIVNGICDAVLVGGVDTLCGLTLRGFHSLELVSETACQPMDVNRNGINIGEGAALLVLEKNHQGTVDCPQVMAVGESSDAYHMSSPHPEGDGAVNAMSNALKLSGMTAENIDYLNLHATATPVNDQVEAKAVARVFGNQLPVSGTKGITGHTLGAAGAIEAVASLLAIEHNFIPGTCGLNQIDPAFECRTVKHTEQNKAVDCVMSNSFGFGGNNASVIFSASHG